MKKQSVQLCLLTIVLCFVSSNAIAAFCALRDPVSAIGKLYPSSTSFRSIVKSVGSDIRDEVGSRLPFSLHFNELGRHTLYVPVHAGLPIGIVHVRSELLDWGLVEIAWGMNLDLSLETMAFQRCRSAVCNKDFEALIRRTLEGKRFAEAKALLGQLDKQAIYRDLGDDQRALFKAVLKSALKTLAVTESGWAQDIRDLRNEATVATALSIHDGRFSITEQAVPDTARRHVRDILKGQTVIDTDSVRVFAVERDQLPAARLVLANWTDHRQTKQFAWVFDADEIIRAIKPMSQWPNEDVAQSFAMLHGVALTSHEQCGTAAELAGFELTYLSRQALKAHIATR